MTPKERCAVLLLGDRGVGLTLLTSRRGVPYILFPDPRFSACWFERSQFYRVFRRDTDERFDCKTADSVFDGHKANYHDRKG